MKGKYITTQILLTCWAAPVKKRDIHAELEETIRERKKIMDRLEGTARTISMYVSTTKAA